MPKGVRRRSPVADAAVPARKQRTEENRPWQFKRIDEVMAHSRFGWAGSALGETVAGARQRSEF